MTPATLSIRGERRAVKALRDLHSVTQKMFAAYQNDRGQRAEAMQRCMDEAEKIARPVLDSYPPGYGERSK